VAHTYLKSFDYLLSCFHTKILFKSALKVFIAKLVYRVLAYFKLLRTHIVK